MNTYSIVFTEGEVSGRNIANPNSPPRQEVYLHQRTTQTCRGVSAAAAAAALV